MAGIVLGWLYGRRLVSRPELWGGKPPMTVAQADDFLLWITLGIVVGGRLGFNNPEIGIEADLLDKARLNFGIGRGRPPTDGSREHALCRPCLIKRGLRRRSVQSASAVEPIDLDEYGASLLGAAREILAS